MAFCKNCGTELANGAAFCSNCGAAAEAPATAPMAVAVEAPKNRGLEVKTLVWAIINFAFFIQALGVVAFVFTLLAANRPDPDAENKLKVARTCNKIGLIAGIIIWVLVILIFAFVFFIYFLLIIAALSEGAAIL